MMRILPAAPLLKAHVTGMNEKKPHIKFALSRGFAKCGRVWTAFYPGLRALRLALALGYRYAAPGGALDQARYARQINCGADFFFDERGHKKRLMRFV